MTAGPTENETRPAHVHRKMLVVDLGFLGDTIHLIPALWELRRHHPESAIHVVTTPLGGDVLGLVGCVDRIWTMPLGKPSPPWWRHLDLQWHLRREKFDFAINFSGADRTLFVAGFSGARERLTRAGSRSGWWRRHLGGRVVAAPSRALPVFEQRRQVLAAAGYDLAPTRFDLAIPEEARRWADDALGRVDGLRREWVHLSINASSPFKEWPMHRWEVWVREFLSRGGAGVLATAADQPRERERLSVLASAVGDARLATIASGLTLPRLAALLAKCRLHVGTDSGVTHLAMALGLPTVSVFRDYAGLQEWRPTGPGHAAVTSPCQCVDRPAMRPECANTGVARCLEAIDVASVMAVLDRLESADETLGGS